MQYQLLGNTGMRVSRICLGTATFGIAPIEEDAPTLVHRALDLGINFFNTATQYGNYTFLSRPGTPPWDQRKSAEEILGMALKGHRNEVIIASKVGMRVGEGPNDGGRPGGGLSRYNIMKLAELSLKRLQTDHIDVYYGQMPDSVTPLEETLRAFDDLVHQGKVRYIGLSNFPAWQMAEAIGITREHNLSRIIGQECSYSMVNRQVERELVPACLHFGLSLTGHTALGGGLLTGMDTLRSRPASQLGSQRWYTGGQAPGPAFSPAQMRAAEQLDAVSREWGIPAAQLALGWLLSRPALTSAIMGAETVKELEQNAAAADLKLNQAQIETLDPIGKSA